MTDPTPDEGLLRLLRELKALGYGFVTPTPATVARVLARRPGAPAQDLRDVFGWSRPFAPALLPDGVAAAMRSAGMLASEESGLVRSPIRVSGLDGDLYVHSAYPTVAADAVFFGPDTYRFTRAIRGWLAAARPVVRRSVDIGCGAGPGGIVAAKAFPDARTVMVDINETALRYARVNAAAAGCPNASAVASDLLSQVDGSFDLIVSNPPYLNDPLGRAYRHGGGELGAALSVRIAREALGRLADGGTLLLYTGVAIVEGRDPFLAEIAADLPAAGVRWSYEEADPDVFGEEIETGTYAAAERIAAVVLIATRRQ